MESILILDFGSQYTQLIARRLRELEVYCEIHPFHKIPEIQDHVKGIILSGSPFSVRAEGSPRIDLDGLVGKLPILGVCYGAQLLSYHFGGNVEASATREYGRARLQSVSEDCELLKGVPLKSQVWMSHGDTITAIPDNFRLVSSTETVPVAAFAGFESTSAPVYGIQFHPEVTHSDDGFTLLSNFVKRVCKCVCDWTPASFIDQTISDIQSQVGSNKVILGLSGGVDSSVAALLIHRAIGTQLHCVFVDNGLLRKDEFSSVLESYKGLGLNVKGVNASTEFYSALAGLTDPELKRKAIGRVFVEVFEKEAKSITDAKWLAQGTIYPDVIESVSVNGPSVTIKSHHNVGGLPEKLGLSILEPLRSLFKDEVRRVGKALELPADILNRHPFPGPGLGIRILGEILPDRVRILQEADAIYTSALRKHGLYDQIWQAGAILLPVNTVGVMGDERTYESVVALRAVNSSDGMTADWCRLPYDFFAEVSTDIINSVRGVNRVVYDISTKPPATIEWE